MVSYCHWYVVGFTPGKCVVENIVNIPQYSKLKPTLLMAGLLITNNAIEYQTISNAKEPLLWIKTSMGIAIFLLQQMHMS